jgi:hypothetical protein
MRQTRHATLCALVCATVFAGAALAVTQKPSPPSDAAQTLCRDAASELERTHCIPKHLLAAIALAESGRWDASRGESFVWPWTVTAGGRSRYFETKAAALADVRALEAEGARNIDVGCMQINLLHHPDAFQSLDQAFEPAVNAAYAAGFLGDLHRQTRSWSRAVAFYHSRTKSFYQPYRKKVYKLRRVERQRAAAVHRAEVIATYLERKSRRETALAERRRNRQK